MSEGGLTIGNSYREMGIRESRADEVGPVTQATRVLLGRQAGE